VVIIVSTTEVFILRFIDVSSSLNLRHEPIPEDLAVMAVITFCCTPRQTQILVDNSKMDNSNRFHLNLNPNNLVRPGCNDRAYPTTPSTFPNSINPPFPSGEQLGRSKERHDSLLGEVASTRQSSGL
jgi:hypothetical protein